ncbi:MAG TPA: hypothetical protein PKU99_07920 [Candidatus Saccharicenans sp.]|nr:hypothetical protein [Candidatus Saccharicenans sp.]
MDGEWLLDLEIDELLARGAESLEAEFDTDLFTVEFWRPELIDPEL